MFLLSKLKVLIAGGIIWLVMRIVKSMIAKTVAAEQKRAQAAQAQRTTYAQDELRHRDTPSPAFKNWVVKDTIWQGMNSSDLLATYGEPVSRKRNSSAEEIWVYTSQISNDNRVNMTVMLENGIVKDWQETHSDSSAA